MPATLRGIYNYNIYPQPDFSADQDQNGGWVARQSYIVTKTTWASSEWRSKFSRGTQITVVNPSLEGFYSFLRIASSSFTDEGGDIITVNVEYAGTSWSQFDDKEISTESEPTYRLEGRIGERSIAEHPKFKALAAVEQSSLQRLLNDEVIWFYDDVFTNAWGLYEIIDGTTKRALPDGQQLTSKNGIAFAEMIAKGLKSYMFPTVTWTETTSGTSSMTSQQLNKLGKISIPRGDPPEANGTRNWMLTGASQEQRGELYQTTLEWTLSEEDGWDKLLYD